MNERIKELRRSLGLTQDEFGGRIGITKSSVSTMESGRSNPSEQTLRSMVREFGASYLWLTTGAGPMFENGEEAAVHVMIDRVMAGENEHVKNLFKSLSDWSAEDWQQVDRLLDKLLAGWTPWADSPGDNKKED
jgi:transcriptional regulator with XRE-family HTH domain